MQWTHKYRQKKVVTPILCLWVVTTFLAGIVTACGPASATGHTSVVTLSLTVTPQQAATPTVSLPTAIPPTAATAPSILPGDWPSFLLGRGGFNSSETTITTATVLSLTRSWTAHAGGGISSEPVVVDGTVYWGSWDGYEHATSITGQARWSTSLGSMLKNQSVRKFHESIMKLTNTLIF